MEIAKRKVSAFEVVDIGIRHEQFFVGFGVASTPFDMAFVGIGDSAREALVDALEDVAMNGSDLGILLNEDWDEHIEKMSNQIVGEVADDIHYYVGIRVKWEALE